VVTNIKPRAKRGTLLPTIGLTGRPLGRPQHTKRSPTYTAAECRWSRRIALLLLFGIHGH
jgi:hypothetical protein